MRPVEVIRGLHNLRRRHRGCVATVGGFDGVHRGHRAVLARLRALARTRQLPSTLVTFEPLPQEYFSGDAAPARLTRFREKVRALDRTPPDRLLVLRFDGAFSRLAPEHFLGRILAEGLGLRYLVVGDDFRFGHRGAGDYALIESLAGTLGFTVERRPTLEHGGRRVSSSWVREALAGGDLALAAQLLGRPYTIEGRVAQGRRLGRTIGFPTANLPLRRRVSPLRGVYAVRARHPGREAWPGMANVGTRPTVAGEGTLLEIHLFDFAGDLYGRPLEVEFVHRLREERRFESLDALRAQLGHDASQARAVLHG
jgi:riboflavin kinase / FMN adenylyltransferase